MHRLIELLRGSEGRKQKEVPYSVMVGDTKIKGKKKLEHDDVRAFTLDLMEVMKSHNVSVIRPNSESFVSFMHTSDKDGILIGFEIEFNK